MKRFLAHFPGFAVLLLLFLSTSFSVVAHAGTMDQAIASRTADISGVKLHYLTAGLGPTVILLRGFVETSRMWARQIATFSQ